MIFETLDKALSKSDSKAGLFLLNQAFRFGIPFNIPHAFRINKLSQNESTVVLPKIKTNKNHLGTIHACAMATAGEFVAGVLLIKNFGATHVRVVLKDLVVEYHRQGTTRLEANASIDQNKVVEIKDNLDGKDKLFVNMEANLTDTRGELVCTVKTKWQVKKWSAVSSKF